jgi:mannose-6-phosphate isomerase-like protein (cupin superfamily)
MVVRPYTEEKNDIYIRRKFNSLTNEHELEWHRDVSNREVVIIESGGWKFQMDNSIPIELKSGDVLFIPAKTFHRVIKGSGSLIVEIREL